MDVKEKADLDLVEKHVKQLGEFFDSVQIFTTRHEQGEKDGTINIALGCGNWFSRYGQVRDYLVKQDERTRKYIQREDDK